MALIGWSGGPQAWARPVPLILDAGIGPSVGMFAFQERSPQVSMGLMFTVEAWMNPRQTREILGEERRGRIPWPPIVAERDWHGLSTVETLLPDQVLFLPLTQADVREVAWSVGSVDLTHHTRPVHRGLSLEGQVSRLWYAGDQTLWLGVGLRGIRETSLEAPWGLALGAELGPGLSYLMGQQGWQRIWGLQGDLWLRGHHRWSIGVRPRRMWLFS
jgi:hypothetical protein